MLADGNRLAGPKGAVKVISGPAEGVADPWLGAGCGGSCGASTIGAVVGVDGAPPDGSVTPGFTACLVLVPELVLWLPDVVDCVDDGSLMN